MKKFLTLKKLTLLYFFFTGYPAVAQQQIDSVKMLISRSKEATGKAVLLRKLGSLINNQNPRASIIYLRQSIELSKQLNYKPGLQGAYLNLANTYSILSLHDSSILFCDSSISYSDGINLKPVSLAYVTKGSALMGANRYKEAIESINQGIAIAEKLNSPFIQAGGYTSLGNIYYFQAQFDKALEYYQKSMSFLKKDPDLENIAGMYINIANVYDEKKDFINAKANYEEGIKMQKELEDDKGLMSSYFNLAICNENLKLFKQAEENYKEALRLSIRLDDKSEQASIASNYGGFLVTHKRFPEAEKILLPALDMASTSKDEKTEQLILETLSSLYEAKGNMALAYVYLKRMYVLKDSIHAHLVNTEVLSLQTKFETVQKDKEISLLNKDKIIQQEHIARQTLMRNSIIGGVVVLVLFAILLLNRYRTKQKLKELTIRNKIATDLHDDIGSTLSSVSFMSEFVKQRATHSAPDLIPFIDKMGSNSREMIEAMKDIVWSTDTSNDNGEKMIERMQEFMKTIFQGTDCETHFSANEDFTRAFVSPDIRKNIFLLFKEAVHNAAKYSECKELKTLIEKKGKQLRMTVTDNGKGFDIKQLERVNGLDNMRKRANDLQGKVEIFSEPGKGTTITLQCPIT